MKLQIFNGGQNSRLAPQLLQQNQAVELVNVDLVPGVLTPEQDKEQTSLVLDKYSHYFYSEQKWVSSPVPTDYLEFQGKLYSTDRVTRPKKFDGTSTQNLGIARPSIAPTVQAVDDAEPLTEFTALNDVSAGTLPPSDLEYLIVNIKNGVKAVPYQFVMYATGSEVSRAKGKVLEPYFELGLANPITVRGLGTRQVLINEFKGDLGDSVEVYRKYNNEWRLVAAVTDFTSTITDDVEDISTNDLLDESEFTSFNGTYQYVYTYYNSSDGTESAPSPVSDEVELQSGFVRVSNILASSDSQVDKIRLYRVGNNLTQFTLVTELSNASVTYDDKVGDTEVDGRLLESDNYYEAPSGLKYLTESYAMLFGALGSQLRFTPIGKPNAWPPEYSLEFNAEITGIGPVANGLLVMTRFRTFVVTGTGPLSLAQQPLRGDQGCIAFESVQEITQGMLMWASADGLCMSSGNNVVVTTKNLLGKYTAVPVDSAVVDEVYYLLNEDGSILVWDYRFSPSVRTLSLGVQSLAVANSELYGWNEGVTYKLFASINKLSMTYKSPRLTEGSLTQPKTYKKVYIRSEGDIIINILIDDVNVASKTLSSKDTHEMLVPQDKQRGFYIQFEITGTGTVHEIEYVAGLNRNG